MKTCFCSFFAILPLLFQHVSGTTCTLGRTDLQETSANPNPGLYIDPNTPAPCSGVVLRWRMCFYNPFNFHSENTVQIGLQVWRFNSARTNGSLIGENVLVITIPEDPQPFQCITRDMSEGSYIDVMEGDVLGVTLRQDMILPVVANPPPDQPQPPPLLIFAQPSLFTINNVNTQNGESATVNSVIQVTADIGDALQTMTSGPIPDANSNGTPTNQFPMTTDSVLDGGLSPGATAAVVIIVLLVVALAVVGVVVGVVLLYGRGRGKVEKKVGHSTQDPFTIDNAMYDPPGTLTGISMASTYEVPVDTVKRKNNYHPAHAVSDGGGVYSTVEGGGGRGGGGRGGFLDSFESEYNITAPSGTFRSQQLQQINSASGGFNPYATLTTTGDIAYYNTFFQKATDAIYYSTPDAGSTEDPYCEPPNDEEDIYKELSRKTRTIQRNEIIIQEKIGEGAFSSVSKGSWTIMGRSYDVAVKSLIQNSSEVDKIKLLQEAAIMGQFQHPNIVKLFGVIKQGNLPMLVTEFLHKGDLLNTLQIMQPDPGQLVEEEMPQLLLNFSQQVALGMHYLSSKGFVHRDLAARNIFVTKDNICKVGDFGMSRELADTDYYVSRGGVVPVRWTAPEAIFYRKYSTASDMWSYGCLLYEIWTLGMRPYEGIETNKYLETLQVGYRLPPPPGCPRAIYAIMMKCWNPTASHRPNFSEIITSTLRDKQEEVLSISDRDRATHEQASLLGAGLEAGLEMYKDLQNIYLKQKQSRSSQREVAPKVPKRNATMNGRRSEDGLGGDGDPEKEWNDEGVYETEKMNK